MGNKINLHKRCIGIAMFILLVFGVNNNLDAQQYFQKNYDINNGKEIANYFLKFNDTINYIFGNVQNNLGYNDLVLAKTDSNFNIIWSKNYTDSTNKQAIDITKTIDSALILNCYSYSQNQGSCTLIKVDLNGDTIWTKNYRSQYGGINIKYLTTIGDTVFYFGSVQTDSISDKILSGIIIGISNNSGSILYSNSFKLGSHLSSSFALAKVDHTVNEDNYWILGYAYTDFFNYYSDCFLMKLNLHSNENSVTILTDTLTSNSFYNLDISDNHKILVGFTTVDSTLIGKHCFAELDTSFNVLWAKKYWDFQGSPSFNQSLYLPNNTGFVTSLAFNLYNMDKNGNVMKVSRIYLDSNLSSPFASFNQIINYKNNLLWLGMLRWGSSFYNFNMLLTKTNVNGVGCIDNNQPVIMVDTTSLFPVVDTTIIKNSISINEFSGISYSPIIMTSSTDCISTLLTEQIITNEETISYVNPFSDFIRIDGLDKLSVYNLTIYNSIGQLINKYTISNSSDYEIPTTSYKAGLYFFSLESKLGRFRIFKIIKT